MADEQIIETATVVEQPTFTVRVADDGFAPESPAIIESPDVEIPTVLEIPTVVETVVEPVKAELDDQTVLSYLKEKGIDATDFEALKPKEQRKLREESEKLQDFLEKTNGTLEDFVAIQKDWSKESPETVIKRQMALDYPDLEKEDIDFQFDRKYGISDLEEEDDAKEIKARQLDLKMDSKKAVSAFEKQKEEFMLRGAEHNVPEEFKVAKSTLEHIKTQQEENNKIALVRRTDFETATESVFSKDFEGFKVKVGDEKSGFEEFIIKPSDIKKTKESQLDIANFQNKFFDVKTEKLIDPVGYHKSLYAGMNPDEYANHFYQLGMAAYAEKEDKASKNITMDGTKVAPLPQNTGITVKQV